MDQVIHHGGLRLTQGDIEDGADYYWVGGDVYVFYAGLTANWFIERDVYKDDGHIQDTWKILQEVPRGLHVSLYDTRYFCLYQP